MRALVTGGSNHIEPAIIRRVMSKTGLGVVIRQDVGGVL